MSSVMLVVVTEALAHDLRVDAGLQREARPRVAQIVHADASQARVAHRSRERATEAIGMQHRAVFLAEHEIVLLPEFAGGQVLFELALPVRTQCDDGLRVDTDAPA